MKRLAGQAGRSVGYLLHHTGMVIITGFFVLALSIGGLAYRLSLGPVQIPWLTSRLANAVSGQGVDISIAQAALAWGGYKNGGGVPLFLQLRNITARNSAGLELVEIPSARLVFLPGALIGTKAPIMVTSSDGLFAGSKVTVALIAAIRLGFLHFSEANLFFTLGPGALGGGGLSLPISHGSFNVDITPDSVSLSDGQLALAAVNGNVTMIGFSGQGHLRQNWQGSLNVTADAIQADALPAYWPAGLVVQTRNWVTNNITAGSASDADFSFGLSAPATLTSLSLDTAAGHFNGHDLSVGWVPHAAPITGVSGVFTLNDRDTINISAAAGQLGGIALHAAHLRISGVSQKDQLAVLSVPVSGDVTSMIKILNTAPLNVLQLAPPILLQAKGAMTGTVAAQFPLKNNLQLAQVDLAITAHLTGVTAPTPIAGLDFSNGEVDLQSSTKKLTAKATATLDGAPALIDVTAGFGSLQPVIMANVKTIAGQTLLQRFGLASGDAIGGLAGAVPVNGRIMQNAAGVASATLDADLTPAALQLAPFGWSKPAGKAGHFGLSAIITPSGDATVTAVSATGPGLEIAGQAVAGQPQTLRFSRLQIGATSAAGIISAGSASEPWRVTLSGPVLDVSRLTSRTDTTPATPKPAEPAAAGKSRRPSGPVWQADLRFGQLILAAGTPRLHGLVFHGNGQGGSVFNAVAKAADDDGQVVDVTMRRDAGPAPEEVVHLDTSDGGFLLRALGLYGNLQSGAVLLDAHYTDASDISGVVKIAQFRILHAPAIGKILQGMTVYGVGDATSGPGLVFDRLVAPFSLGNGVLTLQGARAFSSSLGFTASGTIGVDDGLADLDTTIIPAYVLNSAPGRIPVIGKLFSAETGGGLFAMRAKITGRLSDPEVTVNPLSALTPGLLRDVFGLGGAATPGSGPAPQKP